jgi:hypothetical protein
VRKNFPESPRFGYSDLDPSTSVYQDQHPSQTIDFANLGGIERKNPGLSCERPGFRNGRDGGIRTHDHLNPIQVLYQTEPHPEENPSEEAFSNGWDNLPKRPLRRQ